MTARRQAVGAVLAAVLAVVLWWLSRGTVEVLPPAVDPPVEGMVQRGVTTTWLLLSATVTAGVAMVLATLALVRGRAGAEA